MYILRRSLLTQLHVFALLLGNAVNVTILAIMTAVSPVQYSNVDVSFDAFNRVDKMYGRCNLNKDHAAFLVPLA